MKKLYTKFLGALVIVFTLVVGATSCNSDKGYEPGQAVYYDIVTLVSTNDKGTVVSLQQDGDSPLVTLTFPEQRIDTTLVPVKSRFLIAYTTSSGKPYESGTATLYGIGYVYNSVLTYGTKDSTHSWATMQQNILSFWRTGNWINIQAECTYTSERPKTYDLVVDETTLDTDYPEVHLIYEPSQSGDGLNTKLFYSSFNIEDVWSLPNVKGLKVSVYGNNGMKTYTFSKEREEQIQPNA